MQAWDSPYGLYGEGRNEMKQTRTGTFIEILKVDKEHLDASNYAAFKEKIHKKIKNSPDADGYVLDLSLVMFIDSAGLGAVLSIFRALNEKGIEMKVAGVTGAVKILFELVRLNRIIGINDTVDAAVQAFSP